MRKSFLRRQRNADLVVLWPGLGAHLRLLPRVDPELRDMRPRHAPPFSRRSSPPEKHEFARIL